MTQSIYTVGGTVQAGGGIYIPRKADDELLAHCRTSEFAFILSSRQVGKSSLMVRTAQQLEKEGIRSVIVDLSSIGVNISADEWYLGILNEVANTLELKADIFAWWTERAALSPATRMTNFFRDVLLKEVSQPVVLFFDELTARSAYLLQMISLRLYAPSTMPALQLRISNVFPCLTCT